KIIFLKAFLSLNRFPREIKSIEDLRDGQTLYGKPDQSPSKNKRSLIVQDVPGYLKLHLNTSTGKVSCRTISTQKTYVVDLEHYPDGDAYLQKHFGTKSRSALRRYKKRLETCFTVQYEVYHGPMDKENFDHLFEKLRELMVHRFEQKNEHNYELQHLDEIKADVYPKLLQKQANLFVIYANNRPVSIRINMMKGKLAYYILSAYDPDYDIFRLGKLDMWQNIDWLIGQGYAKYDLLKGYGYIKERWADQIHGNDLVFINSDHSLFGQMKFNMLVWKTKLKIAAVKMAKRIKLDKLIRKWKGDQVPYKMESVETVLVNDAKFTEGGEGKRILDISKSELTKPLLQLAYKHQFPVDQILINQNAPYENEYYVQLQNECYLLKIK
ncbi:MAG: GNAT family N-acetyltransferase, partial [Muricauda sp.]|nr:GNAT family N-acetyltransferase [Allomuricauda sp.]